MKFLQLKITLVLVSFLFTLYGCDFYQDCDGCGGCKYSKFEETFKIGQIDISLDTNYKIQFISTNDSSFKFELFESYINKCMIDSSNEQVIDTAQIFIIKGRRITSGTCAPKIINQIKIKEN